ncbi:hypothetical protein [Legionella cincinnatiensis]|nr:hypothetical protein [Legionella cincinnatiensis]
MHDTEEVSDDSGLAGELFDGEVEEKNPRLQCCNQNEFSFPDQS